MRPVLPRHEHAAQPDYAAVLSLWSHGPDITRAIEVAYPGEDEGIRAKRLGMTLVAVGEAMFAASETKRIAEAGSFEAPVYAGPAEEGAMRR